ncbi:hypothetical protein EDD63_11244 [Breznakia blatticola]|uniref:Tetratricopeptide repeat protein n=1 Tax=Breznakia blatticola TaxID=1754012 RepID=A0A4R7ZUX0_9FIRM|nr:hypothetical protein [Breznakia blatticola]TDW20578.1 hypothetical protein EDD63_11244 [Breznakia blatticola]
MNYVIIAFVVVALSTIVIQVLKRTQFKKLLTYLQTGDFKTFEAKIDTPLMKYLYPQFNRDYLRLNAYVLQGDEKKIEAGLQKLLSYKMSKKQKEDVYMKAFNYYVGVEKPGKAKEALDLVKTLDHPAMEAEAQRIYDIFMMKKSNYIDEMLEQFEMQDSTAKGVTAYLLSVQYENKGDKANAKKYADISKNLMEKNANK